MQDNTSPPPDEPTSGTPAGASESSASPAVESAPSPDPDTQAEGSERVSDEELHRQEQERAAAAQNLDSANAVPEQRPQAFTQPVGTQSDTAQALADAGHPAAPGAEPMGKDAYDKAASDEQAQSAADASRSPSIRVGDRVRIDQDGPFKNHNAVVVDLTYVDHANEVVHSLGSNESRFAEVETIIVRTRDGRTDTVELSPDEVTVLDPMDWGRSAI